MGKKNKSKYENRFKEGDVFGDWTVTSPEIFIEHEAKVKCICGRCNVECKVSAYTLINGKSSRCKECGIRMGSGKKNGSWKGYKEIPASWFGKFRRKSNEIGTKYEGDLTIEDVYNKWIEQDKKCALTGIDLSFQGEGRWTENGNYTKKYDISLDRIDSSKGYTADNIQLVHKDINQMKHTFDQSYFIKMCKMVSEHSGQCEIY